MNSDGEVPSDLILALLVDRSLELPGLEHRPFSDEEIKEVRYQESCRCLLASDVYPACSYGPADENTFEQF